MADTPQKLSDLYIPTIEGPYVNERSTTKSALWTSGLVVPNADLARQLGANIGGNQFITPFNRSIEDDDAEDGNDQVADKIEQTTFGTSSYQANAVVRTKSYGQMNLATIFAGNNPVSVLNTQLANFWVNNYQKELVACLTGVFADNVANDGSDMVVDVFNDVTTPTADKYINSDNVIEALHTMGDLHTDLEGGAIIMHSKARKLLQKAEPNNFIPASQSDIGFTTYNGLMIIEDDGVPIDTGGSNADKYVSYIVGAGMFQYAQDPRLSNEEWDRDITAGHGTGNDFIVTRRRFILTPQGFDLAVNGGTNVTIPTRTELALATTWDRKVASRRQVKIAALYHNV